ncbi:MAG: hypothetical protein Q7S64_02460 [bacterium]|nr:hypothetical protein [bacterium]
MNEVIRLSVIEILYLTLIVSVSVLTIYLAITLARLGDVLRDIKQVTKVASGVAGTVEAVKQKAMSTFVEAADAIVKKLRGSKKGSITDDEVENENDDF